MRQGDEHGAGNHRMCSLTLERVLFSLLQNACGKEMSMAQAIISSPTLGVDVLDADWKVLQVFFLFYFFIFLLPSIISSPTLGVAVLEADWKVLQVFFFFSFFPPFFLLPSPLI